MTILGFVLQLVLGVVLTANVLRWDMRRSPPERLARGWSPASFWSAVVAFGPLCLPVHFARTRRSVLGFLLGALWAVGVLFVIGLASDGLDALLELLRP